ncbi:hypothetical protein M758_UG314100 [Ceratodon purpureus]|nr:hypothetical protein M758_UG314100 [Ceratodon purpureus]
MCGDVPTSAACVAPPPPNRHRPIQPCEQAPMSSDARHELIPGRRQPGRHSFGCARRWIHCVRSGLDSIIPPCPPARLLPETYVTLCCVSSICSVSALHASICCCVRAVDPPPYPLPAPATASAPSGLVVRVDEERLRTSGSGRLIVISLTGPSHLRDPSLAV